MTKNELVRKFSGKFFLVKNLTSEGEVMDGERCCKYIYIKKIVKDFISDSIFSKRPQQYITYNGVVIETGSKIEYQSELCLCLDNYHFEEIDREVFLSKLDGSILAIMSAAGCPNRYGKTTVRNFQETIINKSDNIIDDEFFSKKFY